VDKGPDAFRTISEVGEELDVPQHVLRFWETRFSQIKPLKRGGGRRYYRPDDVELLRGIRHLLYGEGYTIKGVQRILKQEGVRFVQQVWQEPGQLATLAANRGFADEGEGDQDDAIVAETRHSPSAPRQIAPHHAAARETVWAAMPEPGQNGTVARTDGWAPEVETRHTLHAQGESADGELTERPASVGLGPAAIERLSEVLEELRECRRLIALARGVVDDES
jgi:DNA-binding transcriptional MerR regulator